MRVVVSLSPSYNIIAYIQFRHSEFPCNGSLPAGVTFSSCPVQGEEVMSAYNFDMSVTHRKARPVSVSAGSDHRSLLHSWLCVFAQFASVGEHRHPVRHGGDFSRGSILHVAQEHKAIGTQRPTTPSSHIVCEMQRGAPETEEDPLAVGASTSAALRALHLPLSRSPSSPPLPPSQACSRRSSHISAHACSFDHDHSSSHFATPAPRASA